VVAGRSHSVLPGVIHLRPFRNADFEALYRIDNLCFTPGIAYSKAELGYYLKHPKSFTVVAETPARTIAGFCTGQTQMQEGQPVGHIITIDVLPDWRRQEVGRSLLRSVEERFRAKSANSVRLEVAVDNLQAQAFYRAMGYAQVGVIPGYYGGQLDALVMQKELTGDALRRPQHL
jgi:ribosomal protein S18 acetylase RimI-like enzyme